MSLWLLYTILVLIPNLHAFSSSIIWCPTIIVMFISGLAFIICVCTPNEPDTKNIIGPVRYVFKYTIRLTLMLSILGIILPNQKQMYMVAGGYVVTNNKEVQALPDNVMGAANAYLAKLKEELEPAPKGETHGK